MTACLQLPAGPAVTDRRPQSRRLVLILDQRQDRLHATAGAIAITVPDAVLFIADAVKDLTEAAGPPADAILVRADPDGWAAASVLAAHRPPGPGRTVDAYLVAEGPLDKFSVLITDFPGLRLLPPRAGLAAFLAGKVRDAILDNTGARPEHGPAGPAASRASRASRPEGYHRPSAVYVIQ